MNRLLALTLPALLSLPLAACLPDDAALPDEAADAGAADVAPDAMPDAPDAPDAPDDEADAAVECDADGCPPVITEAGAWAGDDAVHLLVAGYDDDADIARRGATLLDGTPLAGGYGRFVPDAVHFAVALPLDGMPMPEAVELYIEDRAGHLTTRRVALAPLPRRDRGEACDPMRVVDGCLSPYACRGDVCVDIFAPELFDAALYTTGETIGISAQYLDADGDLFVVQAEIEGVDHPVNFRPDHDAPSGRCARGMAGTLWVEGVPVGARARVIAYDREGLASAPIEAVFQAPPLRRDGEVCDRFETWAVCGEGRVCDVQAPITGDPPPRCFTPSAECPADWPVADAQAGARVDVDWRDLAALDVGDAVGAAAEAAFTRGSCSGGVSPVAAFAFVAPAAGVWDVYVQPYHDDSPPAVVWARDGCDAPRTGELACAHGAREGGSTLALDLDADEQVTIFVASDRVWEGQPHYQLSISGQPR